MGISTAERGRVLAPVRVHASLHFLGRYGGLPQGVAASAIEAATAVVMLPFDVLFDRAASFRGRPGNHPPGLR